MSDASALSSGFALPIPRSSFFQDRTANSGHATTWLCCHFRRAGKTASRSEIERNRRSANGVIMTPLGTAISGDLILRSKNSNSELAFSENFVPLLGHGLSWENSILSHFCPSPGRA